MKKTNTEICAGLALVFALASAAPGQTGVTKYVRYEAAGRAAYGVLEGDVVRELSAAPWSDGKPTGKTARVTEVRLLAPSEPSKVIAVGLNYKSHIGERTPAAYPGLFAKLPTTIIGPDAEIVLPSDAQNTHYEGELVVVIGKKASRVSVADAASHIFGVTAGNDVSERDWQRSDLQWLRAKGTDTFGPLGPVVVRGLDYSDLLVQTRLNGEVRQSQRTKDLIFGVDAIVSYVSQYVTLVPGDVIYTGTPGTTKAMAAGDVVEIEVEGVGVLRNKVVRGGSK